MSLVLLFSQLRTIRSYNLNENEKYAVGNLQDLNFFRFGSSYYLGYTADSKFSKTLLKQLKKEAKAVSHKIEGKIVSFFAGKANGDDPKKLARKNSYPSIADWWKAKHEEITTFTIPVGDFLIYIKPDGSYKIKKPDQTVIYESPIYGLFKTDSDHPGDPGYTSYYKDSFVFPLYRIPS